MVTVQFPDRETQDRAIGCLTGFFSGHVLRSGEVVLPEPALGALVDQDFSFTVIGKATDAQKRAALRGEASPPGW